MTDERLRELEQRWKASGSPEDEAAYLLERVRTGDLEKEKMELAAYCGHEGARLALGDEAPEVPSFALPTTPYQEGDWLERFARPFVRWGRATLLSLGSLTLERTAQALAPLVPKAELQQLFDLIEFSKKLGEQPGTESYSQVLSRFSVLLDLSLHSNLVVCAGATAAVQFAGCLVKADLTEVCRDMAMVVSSLPTVRVQAAFQQQDNDDLLPDFETLLLQEQRALLADLRAQLAEKALGE